MKRFLVLGVLSLAVLAMPVLTQERGPALDGFSADSARTERQWEDKFRAMPSADNMRESMRRLTLHPHHVGSPYDKDNAEWLLAQFKSYGWDAHIETFYGTFPDAEGAIGRACRANEIYREAARAGGARRSDVESTERATAYVQRLLD